MECGFDKHFNTWCEGTMPGNWPLPENSKVTLRSSSSVAIIYHFWWFTYRQVPTAWKAVLWTVLEGIATGVMPLFYGMIVTTCGKAAAPWLTHPDNPKEAMAMLSANNNELRDELMREFLYVAIGYAAAFFLGRFGYWQVEMTTGCWEIKHPIRYILFGRLLRFRPLPVPAESTEVVNYSVDVEEKIGEHNFRVFSEMRGKF